MSDELSKGPDDTVELTVGELLDLLGSAAEYGYWRMAADHDMVQPDPTVQHKQLVDEHLARLGIGWAGL